MLFSFVKCLVAVMILCSVDIEGSHLLKNLGNVKTIENTKVDEPITGTLIQKRESPCLACDVDSSDMEKSKSINTENTIEIGKRGAYGRKALPQPEKCADCEVMEKIENSGFITGGIFFGDVKLGKRAVLDRFNEVLCSNCNREQTVEMPKSASDARFSNVIKIGR